MQDVGRAVVGQATRALPGLGHGVIGSYERGVFVLMLAIGCIFEAAWQITRGTNAMT
jgi:hypothetical protein